MSASRGGADLVFTTPGSNVVTNFDFSDTLTFNDLDFNLGLPNPGPTPQPLPAALFSTQTNGTFDNTTERFAFNQSTGQLLYSAHGSGGSPQPVVLLADHPALSASNLFYSNTS
jgi:hypothetical protein